MCLINVKHKKTGYYTETSTVRNISVLINILVVLLLLLL